MSKATIKKLISAMSLMLVLTFFNPSPAQAAGVFINLVGRNYEGVNWQGADLTVHDLTNANLKGANLRQAQLCATILRGADLTGADLTGARIWNATNPTFAVASTDFSGANLTNANISSGSWTKAIAIGTNFSSSNLAGATLENSNFKNSNFTGANLTNANFTNSDLTGADLRGTSLDGAILAGANLANVSSGEITGTPASLPAEWVLVGGYLVGPGPTLMSADYEYVGPGANLSGANLTNVNLDGVALRGSNLTSANVQGTRLGSADLTGVKTLNLIGEPATLPQDVRLINGSLVGRSLKFDGADLRAVDLSNMDLRGTGLGDVLLAEANLTGVSSGEITGTPASLPTGWKVIGGYLIGPGADLHNSNLFGLDLKGANFKNANLEGATLANATLTGVSTGGITGTPASLPTGWKLIGGYLIGPGADLRDAQLKNSNLEGISLSGVNLTGVTSGGITGTPKSLPTGWKLINGYLIGPGANLDGADLKPLTLTSVISGGITGTPASLPTGWKLIGGYLIGPGASLEGANFKNLNLAGANLINATLTGVSSGGITGTPTTLPTGWKLIGGYLVGAGANLQDANLKNANLTGATLTSATLIGVSSGGITGTPTSLPTNWKLINGYLIGPGANLQDASLKSANLAGAALLNANLAGVSSGGITGTAASLPTGWKLIGGYLIGPGANLQDADLEALNLRGVSSGGITGTPKSLPTGWKLIGGYLIGPGANLQDADLQAVNLRGVSSGGITGTLKSLPTGWKLIGGYLIGPGANLDGASLVNANLSNAELNDVTLLGVASGGITGTPTSLPSGWKLIGGYLIGPGANLKDANLFGLDLEGADLRNADLTQADLRGASLELALLDGATLERAKSGGTLGLPASLPERWTLTGSYLIGPKGDVTGYDLSGVDLTGVSSGEISGTPAALPEGWAMKSGYLIGPGANLNGAVLLNVDLTSFDLTNTDLRNATLDNVILTKATLAETQLEDAFIGYVSSGDLKGVPASLPSEWRIKYGYLFGPGADFRNAFLRGADLSNLNLTGVDFGFAKLSDAKLVEANLTNASFRNADILRADFFGATVTGAIFEKTSPAFWSTWVEVEGGRVALLQQNTPTPTMSGVFKVGRTVSVSTDSWDSEVKLTYQWIRDDTPIAGATKTTYQLTINDFDKLISVSVTGTKTGYASVTRTSLLVNTEGGDLSKTPIPTVSGVNQVGQTITAASGTWDSGVNLSFQWSSDGVSIPGATLSSYVLTPEDFGKLIVVEVTGTKLGFSASKQASSGLLCKAGTQTLVPTPNVLGTYKVGQILSASEGIWGTGVTFSYQWLRDNKPISGAVEANYSVTAGDLNKLLSIRVTGTKDGYLEATKSSKATKVGTGVMSSSLPKITGTAKSGSSLKAASGAWVSGAKISYQWLSNGAVIKAATGSSFKLTSAYKGKKISVKVTQSALGYTTATKTSATVTVSK